jgi:hypothetical protein
VEAEEQWIGKGQGKEDDEHDEADHLQEVLILGSLFAKEILKLVALALRDVHVVVIDGFVPTMAQRMWVPRVGIDVAGVAARRHLVPMRVGMSVGVGVAVRVLVGMLVRVRMVAVVVAHAGSVLARRDNSAKTLRKIPARRLVNKRASIEKSAGRGKRIPGSPCPSSHAPGRSLQRGAEHGRHGRRQPAGAGVGFRSRRPRADAPVENCRLEAENGRSRTLP